MLSSNARAFDSINVHFKSYAFPATLKKTIWTVLTLRDKHTYNDLFNVYFPLVVHQFWKKEYVVSVLMVAFPQAPSTPQLPLDIQFSSVSQSCPTLCNPMDCSMPDFPVHHQLLYLTQTHGHQVWCHSTIFSSVILFSICFNLPRHQGLFQRVCSLQQVAKVLEFQPQHQSFQWIFSTDYIWDGLVGTSCCPRDCQESSPTPQSKSITSLGLSLLYSPTLTSIHDYWKNHSLE